MLRKLNSDLPNNYKKVFEDTEQDVHFVNVDLEIRSKEDLQIIIDEFGEDTLLMGNLKFDNDERLASFEISMDSIALDANADEIISGFCSLVQNFAKETRKVWDNCYEKTFDIGFESGNTENSFNTKLRTETLKNITEIGADIVITIYPVLDYTIQTKDESEVT